MRFVDATSSFESWLGQQMTLIKPDLNYKHEQMAKDVFMFMRATFYRWAQTFPDVCPELADAPKVLGVGDLHVENFGTWRDSEGRLVWGINDFDEAYAMPYTNDLVRLAASTRLAIETNNLKIDPAVAYEAIADGYMEWLESGGRPFVLAEKAGWLRDLAQEHLRDPIAFWTKIADLPKTKGAVPRDAETLLKRSLPEGCSDYSLASRRAGLGSLGRIRLVAHTRWRGGMIAREAKAMASSACIWAANGKPKDKYFNDEIRANAVRCHDPMMFTHKNWIVRRLSPDCSKIALAVMPKHEEERFLHAMGRETANIHLGSKKSISEVRRDLKGRRQRTPQWLVKAADDMVRQTHLDWQEWRRRFHQDTPA